MNRNQVAIVTPHHRFPLTVDEEISLRHLRKYLGDYDRYLIGPTEIPPAFNDFRSREFPASCFASEDTYNLLLLSQEFYRAFSQYEYILIYQLDCLVFASNLNDWCDKRWDYAGAPWFERWGMDGSLDFWCVGNGGFALHHIDHTLRVLTSRRLWQDPAVLGARMRSTSAPIPVRKTLQYLKTGIHALGYKNRVRQHIEKMVADDTCHEDVFWSLYAKHYWPAFRIPEPREALGFAFERAPRHCFELAGGRLPFGCHAWTKYDRGFWEPLLVK